MPEILLRYATRSHGTTAASLHVVNLFHCYTTSLQIQFGDRGTSRPV